MDGSTFFVVCNYTIEPWEKVTPKGPMANNWAMMQ